MPVSFSTEDNKMLKKVTWTFWRLRSTVKVLFCCMLLNIHKNIALLLIPLIWVVLWWRCIWSNGKMTLTGETHILGEKPVLVPLYPLQISHGLAWYLTCASLVRVWQLTVWAMAWPCRLKIQYIHHRKHMIPLVQPLS